MDRSQQELEARLRLIMRRRLVVHVMIFAAVMAAAVIGWVLLWAAAGIALPWFLIIGLGWGIALAIEAAEAYSPGSPSTAEIRAEIRANRRAASTRARMIDTRPPARPDDDTPRTP